MTLDDEIARHLRDAEVSGELRGLPGYGRPLPPDEAWDATPLEFRLPFKVLKNAGYAPPEVGWFHERAALQAQIDACTDPADRAPLERRLADLQQKIALRLEGMRANGRF